VESFPFAWGSQWEDPSYSLISQIQSANNASSASYYNLATAPSATDPSANDPLFDGHLIPLGDDENPYLPPDQVLARQINERQRKRCESEAAHPT
jgi:hypothetical protein